MRYSSIAAKRKQLRAWADRHWEALGAVGVALGLALICGGLTLAAYNSDLPWAAGMACALGRSKPTPSPAFERFRYSFFEDTDSARQGLDTQALAALDCQERDRAELMLIEFLPDTRAVIGLGVLRSRLAEPALAGLLEAGRGTELDTEQVYLAKALWRIRPDPRWLGPMTEVLSSADEPVQRQIAAEELRDVRHPAVVYALVQALDDPDGLVRHHAARGLLAMHGLPDGSDDRQHMVYRVMSDDAARREGGKRDILAAIAGRPISAP